MGVFKCPHRHDEWSLASQRLQCVDPNQYHCLLDENGKDTEHCLGKVWIPEGMCPEYNSKVSKIDVSVCESSSCAKQTYWSNEVYKYSVCLDKTGTVTTDSSPQMTTPNDSIQSTNTVVAIIVPAIILIIGVSLTYIVWRRRRRRRRKNQRDIDQHKDEDVPLRDRELLERNTKDHQASDADILEKNRVILYISDNKSSVGIKMTDLDSCGRFGKSIFVSSLSMWELEDDTSLYFFRQPLDGINSVYHLEQISEELKEMHRQTTQTPAIYFALSFNTGEWWQYKTHLLKYDFFNKANIIKI
ncbi:uncharacterized protein LOC125683386 isoform X2 [Ostrea edulis]|uniref:uncharacterized protein LOC125683386 isoform X2 n=1 Tax=Ostrea edulis TaxID=37623 RepID=UPI0024AF8A12|nr:uncharacterized protein LOC125683386 isoform X2 [Ostrea edulis]XP_055998123.1 uncharacterized protein LOC125683386 isoform X2 [Ostrea edulis]